MFKKRHPSAGSRPGTLILGANAEPVQMRVAVIQDGQYYVRECDSVSDLPVASTADSVVWIDVQGVGDGTVLTELAHRFQISPLAMEDLVNATHRPKLEIFEHQALIIAHSVPADTQSTTACQLGIVFDSQYVLTFHRSCSHVLAPIRTRMENPDARLRRNGPDYLVYAILDTCVDGCLPVLERIGESIETLEEEALRQPRPEILAEIHKVKNILVRFRRSIWPQRELVMLLLHTDSRFVAANTKEYLRDTTDHSTQLVEMVDMYRETTSALVSTYMSAVAHRSNEIMKVLTLLTSVFVPPTFLAGVYGMNFSGMPELNTPGAYPLAIAMMALMIAGTLCYFYRRGWLSSTPIAARTAEHQPVPAAANAPTRVVLDADYDRPLERAA